MTDAAIAAPEAPGVELPADAASYTAPISADGMQQQTEQLTPQENQISRREEKLTNPLDKAIEAATTKAREKLEAKEAAEKAPKAEPKETAKVEAKTEAPKQAERAPDGKFAAKAEQQPAQPVQEPKPTQYKDAPARFDDAAKGEWQNAPESVKGAVHRAVKELEDGLTKYKGSHEAYERLREFDETAKTNGRDLKESLSQVVEFENMMKRNPIGALDYALRMAGPRDSQGNHISLNDIVAHISGQSTDQRLSEAQNTIQELRSQIQQMEYRSKVPDMVAEFASTHERFDELTDAIVPLLKQGFTLENAYEFALATRPAAVETKPLIPAETQQALAQTQVQPVANPAGQKSISGAPSAGSDPAPRKPNGKNPSLDATLDRVFARIGR